MKKCWSEVKILLAATFLTLSACGGPKSGYVEDKNYSPPWTEYQLKTTCVSYDSKTSQCTFSTTTPVFIPHPEECDFYLNDGKDKGWTSIPCSSYDKYQKGDHYPDPR